MSWTAELYDDALADMLLERADPEATTRTLGFLRSALALAPGDRVFDQCCGIGSLAIPLAEAGYEVVGVDQSARYIERATATAAGARLQLAVGDATRWLPDRPCAAAFNWNTSFAHGEHHEDDRAMLVRAFESLVPGGRFALDFMNLPQVLRDLQRHVAITRETPRGLVTLTRETSLDLDLGYMDKTWEYVFADGSRSTRTSRLRLYMPHQLVELLLVAGFELVSLYGGESREPLTIDSPRCIALARKARA
jgi:SAM-dependent methyltransferase